MNDVEEYMHCRDPHERVHRTMTSNKRMAAIEAENKAMRQSNEGLSFRVAELEAHVSEMDAARADMRCMFNTIAAAHLRDPMVVNDTRGTYQWVIADWSTIRTAKICSEPFTIGGFNW